VVVALGQPLAEPRLETFLAEPELLDLLRPGFDRLFDLVEPPSPPARTLH
jgi:hypothetical protein